MPGKLNQDKIRKLHDSQQQGGDLIKFDPGETLVFIHPPCREDDEWEPTTGTPVVPITVHYNVGPNDSMVASLDPDDNEILEHPFVKKFLKERKVRISGECPVKEAMSSGEMTEEEMDLSRAKTQYLIGMTPIGHRPGPSGPWTELPRKPGVAMVGRQIFDGVMEILMELDEDVVDMNGAVLLKIQRSGKDRNTKYKVAPDPKTTRKPFKFNTSEKKLILKSMEEGGDCDLFRKAASFFKSTAAVRSIIEGGEVSEDPAEFDDDEETPKSKAKSKVKSKVKSKPEPEPDDEDELDAEVDEDDEDELDEPPPKSKAKSKSKSKAKKSPPDDEDELDELDDEDDEDELDDEDEPPPKVKSKSKPKAKKPPPDDEDDEDELDDDDDDSEDEDDEPPKKTKAKKTTLSDDDDDDDDDMDLEALESRLEKAAAGGGDDEDDEDDEPSRPVKSKSKSKAKKPPDDDEDDEDEPPPKVKSKSKTRARSK